MKHIKTLGLLAIAVMALAAVFGTASASASKFTASKVGAKLTTTTLVNHVFKVTGSSVECKKIEFAGSTEALETETQIVHPAYKECTGFGLPAEVKVTNCKFTLRSNGTINILSTDTINICSIDIIASNIFGTCEDTVPVQMLESGLTYSNGENDIKVNVNASGIEDEVKKSTGICPLTVGKHNNSTYTGESTVQAEGATISWDA